MGAIRDIAIIGAGPSGLSAAKYLLAEKVFNVQLFEQKPTVGGVWAYNHLTIADDDFSIPRTKPSDKADNPIVTEPENGVPQFVSPVYDSLETNIPHTLMNFIDLPFPPGTSLFPRHTVVKEYLDAYAKDLHPLIKISSQILEATKSSEQAGGWDLKVLDLKTKAVSQTRFDALVIASGHYNDPFIPDIPGLKEFNTSHPTVVSHSKFYKSPASFKDKKVVVVGNSASGLDISDQISKVSKVPVIVSEKPTIVTATTNPALIYKPQIAEFRPEGHTVLFSNGDIESDIDHVVFCTGYFYSFPFLRSLSPPVVTDGASALNLYQHMLYAPDPSISFLGIPQRVVPFPFVEAQMAYLARVWAGRLPFPSEAELRDWERAMKQAQEEGQRNIHVLKFPKDLDYINMMHAKSITADRREGLAHAGMGRPSPYWDEEKAWIRAKMAFIKDASRKLGDARHTILDLKQLGFDFEAEKRRDALQEKLEDGPSLGQTKVPASVAIA